MSPKGISFFAILILALLGIAQAQNASEARPEIKLDDLVIEAGTPVDQLAKALKARGIEFGGPGFALEAIPDIDHWTFKLGEKYQTACVFFSKSKKEVTSVSLVVMPAARPSKTTTTWMHAESIALHPDRSYTIHFKAPAIRKKQ